jgi:hypothetical protein
MRAVIAHSNDVFMPIRKHASPQHASANQITVQRKAACACGGGCPSCSAEWQQNGPNSLSFSTAGVHVQRQEAGSETAAAGNGSEMSGADDSGNAQPTGSIWDYIFGKDRRPECARHLGACNISCRSLSNQTQAYERCMTCCQTGYNLCLDTGAFVTPEGGCVRR